MSAAWYLLGAPGHKPEIPALLVDTAFTSNSYTIYLTDLTFVWSESLDRRSIIRRSIDEDTSIDPSEDAEQFRLFLQKIQLGLGGGEGTSLSLSRGSSSLQLRVTAKLPGGFRPLEWTIRLSRIGQSSLTSRLVIPLLRAQASCMRELEALMGILHDKDHVIEKLADKLEATGADLGQLFPAALPKGSRTLARNVAEERIKGLKRFEVTAWEEKMKEEAARMEDYEIGTLVQAVFGHKYGSTLRGTVDSAPPEAWDKWWDNLGDSIQLCNLRRGQDPLKISSLVGQNNNESTSLEDDVDDFQVQATPPSLFMSSKHGEMEKSPQVPSAKLSIDDSTDSADELDVPSQKPAIRDNFPLDQPEPQQRKLGALGRSSAAGRSQPRPDATFSKSGTPSPKPNRSLPEVDDAETTMEEDDGDSAPKPLTPKKSTASPAQVKPKTQGTILGKIGGKKTEEKRRLEGDEGLSPTGTSPPVGGRPLPEQTAKPKTKLGVVGHSKALAPASSASTHVDAQALGGRGRGLSREDAPERGGGGREDEEDVNVPDETRPPRRETSRERADRRRAELRLELAEKAKAPPKKKRKF